MLISTTNASTTPNNNNNNNSSGLGKCSDFSVSSLCRDLRSSPEVSKAEGESTPAVIIGGTGTNWKLELPPHPGLNPALPATPPHTPEKVIPEGSSAEPCGTPVFTRGR
ncbi:hypothetical protein J6590_099822 [Homalodisca vitripennis]|nr:hypothetical protein J6590_030795 [Homalodisca vitripennis]KAG8284584.1 hypothetical protein J6590_099822 [Homalodisca vitripennis]